MSSITVAALPKMQQGDFINNAMMVLLSNGQLIGWGDNTTGALATGITTATNAPAQCPLFDPNTTMPPSDATIVDWSFTNANLYVVYSNGWVYSAGSNSYGQLGHGDTTARPWLKRIEYFVTNSISITRIWACGGYNTTAGGGCAYFQASDYSMFACGANTAGNLGNASTPTTNVSTPAACAGIGHTTNHVIDVAIACAYTVFSTYMLFSDGTLFVAGYNGQGQLGTGNTTNVTGSFVSAKKTGAVNVNNAAQISANAGGTAYGGSALIVDTSGNVWTTGYNAYGQLGINSTTNQSYFTQVTALSNVIKAELGGGYVGYGYAITASSTLYTWGYNGQDNLFQNNTTSPVKVPTLATFTPGLPAKMLFPKGNALSTYAQLIMLTTGGVLAYAGVDNGQQGINSALYPNAYSYVPSPRQILDGSETITDIFIHGGSSTQRWFILTSLGNLYACGSNVDSICTGGITSDTMPANAAWSRIQFPVP